MLAEGESVLVRGNSVGVEDSTPPYDVGGCGLGYLARDGMAVSINKLTKPNGRSSGGNSRSFGARLVQRLRVTCGASLEVPEGFRLINQASDLSADDFRQIEALTYEHGTNFLSYTMIETDRSWLVLENSSDGRLLGAIGFIRQGRYLHLTGLPVCAPELRDRMHSAMIELAERNQVVLYMAWLSGSEVEYYRARGWDTVSLGQDCKVGLTDCSWSGSEYSWLRRQESYCRRQGLQFREIVPASMSPEAWDALRRDLKFIDKMHLAGKTFNEPLRGWEGRPFDGEFGRRRLFVAESPDTGRIAAYLCCNPCRNGTSWAFEMYRSQHDAPRGAVAYLMLQTLRQLKQEGVADVDLCPVPAIVREADGNPRHFAVHFVMWAWRKFGNMYFDVHGIYHFRSRFRPQFTECYRVVWPQSTIGLIVSFAIVSQLWRINLVNLIVAIWSLLTRRKKLVDLPTATEDAIPAPHFGKAPAKKHANDKSGRGAA